ncbi:hypothetical protein FCL53_10635 [Elizabethkingia meningoseptica]|uniref:hypothetical protein n=1 Tax=Elizabethkingia meningoseptica TaxID=238 RepID=UPI0013667967|nr:hypothetical protein [Elizabethkingia meningoseptica]MVW92421.1 hypothetical protein [Elizabethkingia meningoseptica]
MNKVIWTPEKIDKAINKLSEFFEVYGVGEVIMQSDEALINAPEVLSDIADDILIDGEGIIYQED